ncbi:MAG: hypothetical protein AAFU67_06450, partial [Bacteroidota bacterium]
MRFNIRTIIIAAVLFFGAAAPVYGQLEGRFYLPCSFSNVTTVNDSTYTADLSFTSDQTGNGYLANQIQVGWRVLTSTKRWYRIAIVNSSSFASANLTLVEIPTFEGSPSGAGFVYEYDGTNQQIPVPPVNSTGISAAFASVIHSHNAEIGGSGGSIDTGPLVTDGELADTLNDLRVEIDIAVESQVSPQELNDELENYVTVLQLNDSIQNNPGPQGPQGDPATDDQTISFNSDFDSLSIVGGNTIYVPFFNRDNGRILYVRPFPYGDDLFGQVGNPDKEFSTPWGAAAQAQAGDLIYIFPGTYSFGTNYYPDMIKDEVVYYAEEGVIFTGGDTRSFFGINFNPNNGDTAPISYGSNGELDLTLIGHAKFVDMKVAYHYIGDGANGAGRTDVNSTPVPRINYRFDINEIDHSTPVINHPSFDFHGDKFSVTARVKKGKYDGGAAGPFISSHYSDQMAFPYEDVNVDLHFNKVEMRRTSDVRGVFTEYIAGPPRVYPRNNIKVTADEIYLLDEYVGGVGDAGILLSLIHDNRYEKSTLFFDFGKVEHKVSSAV